MRKYNAYSDKAAVKAANHHDIIRDDLFFAGIAAAEPEALKELWSEQRWVNHKGKIPYNPRTGIKARSNDPNTCVYFDEVSAALGEYDGVEYLLGEGVCGIDLDHCIDPMTGKIDEEAYQVLKALDTYAELSPSGTGIHILARGSMPFTGRQGSRDASLQIEMYSEYRFLTITGSAINDKPIADRTEEIEKLAERYFPATELPEEFETVSSPIDPDDDQRMILSALAAIDPAECSYNEWLRIGIGVKEAGFEDDVWDEWSSSDTARYKLGECKKKWSTFADPGKNINGAGVIIELAKGNGWEPGDAFEDEEKEEFFRRKGLQELNAMNLPPVSNMSSQGKPSDTDTIDIATAVPVISTEELSNRPFYAAELLEADIKKPNFIVDGLLSTGGCIIAGPPKIGKSLLAMKLACCVASGEDFLGHKTNKSNVFYFALEDSPSRLKDRLIKQGHGGISPENSPIFSINAPTYSEEFAQMLKQIVEEHGRTLFIIDTLQCIRPAGNSRESEYQRDYPILSQLSSFARENDSAVLLVHHTRKTTDDANPFNMILGSTALQGAVDMMLLLTRSKKQLSESKATLHITGRDVGMDDIEMFFDKDTITWYSAKNLSADLRKNEYENDPIITVLKTIMEEIKNDPDNDDKVFITTAQGLLDEVITRTGECSDISPRNCAGTVRNYTDLLAKDGIYIEKPENSERINGISGKYYRFTLE